jgi:nitrate reductase alpha subunit
MPMLVMLKEHTLPDGETVMVPDRYVRASDFNGKLGQANNPEWKTVAFDETGKVVLPNGAIGFRWGPDGRADQGQWNLEPRRHATATRSSCAVGAGRRAPSAETARSVSRTSAASRRALPAQRPAATAPKRRAGAHGAGAAHPLGKEGDQREALVATVFDLQVANYGVARGLPGEMAAQSFDDDTPYTPAWQERITGTPREQLITVARQFADNADKTQGKSMVIIGAAMNHWYHSDMNYRGIINMLMMCGCIGQSGGGWAHYVGQEKLRPQTGWTALAFALDWIRPPRQMNSTSFFYAHTDQWRYEKLGMEEVLSPLADKKFAGSMIDYNVRAERMGWLPSRRSCRPTRCRWCATPRRPGMDPKDYAVKALKDGSLKMSCTDPDHPANWPRNMFVWRSNMLGSQRQGPRVLPQAPAGHQQRRAGQGPGQGGSQADRSRLARPGARRQARPAGDAGLPHEHHLPVFSDIVLPTATWYEKNDLNTSDMHPFIHPLSTAVDPAWQSRSDWDIYKGFAKKFSEVCVGHLGVEKELVLTPLMHDTPANWRSLSRQGLEARRDRPDPRQDRAADEVVERDYPNVYKRFTALGPLMNKVGNGGKGIAWNTQTEVKQLAELSGWSRPRA